MNSIIDMLIPFMQSHPSIAVALTIIGALRVLMKPVSSLVHTIVDLTPSQKDNEVLGKVEGSKAYAWFLYALDWFASVKIRKDAAAAPEKK